MPETSIRERDPNAKRVRIADEALRLFQAQGYTETTIDQIASAARVGRRTVFHHFPTKEAVLFDHLVVRRETATQRLRERPTGEAPLTSLHLLLRELAEQGYERRLVEQIRAVVATEPQLAAEQFSTGSREFETSLVAALENRCGDTVPTLEIRALTKMVLGWFSTAAQIYFTEERPSLLECFDDVVASCARASARDLRGSSTGP
ncbi:TetR/AcrR family transcriptional regulator [Parafrankia discariae]|uniref:TetR/AcrR family transcriptional regulator n=1 Tax=Parafrankia discariae TaxID=365528 RepID=UPI00037ABE6E|nr:TetR/AcrR family transcriptional regulator [Parafrankia discariae]